MMAAVHPYHFCRRLAQTKVGEGEFGAVYHIDRELAIQGLQHSCQSVSVDDRACSSKAGVRKADDGNAFVLLSDRLFNRIGSGDSHPTSVARERPSECLGEAARAAMTARRILVAEETDVHRALLLGIIPRHFKYRRFHP